MKKIIATCCLFVFLMVGCKQDENEIQPINSLANDLKQAIKTEKVDALQHCCVGCGCIQSPGWGKDYSFPGDNFVRIQSTAYNLNQLVYYDIKVVGEDPYKEKRMILYFPR